VLVIAKTKMLGHSSRIRRMQVSGFITKVLV
jgi:hypothetical protein